MNDLFHNNQTSFYLPNKGITNSKTQIYNEYLHEAYSQIFQIFEKCNLDYYVFAGSAIGYVRNKKNLPWADDYDIIIFEKEKDKFEKVVIPVLNKNGYHAGLPHKVRPDLYPRHAGWQISGKKINKTSFFLCDVFLTTVDSEGYIRNTGNFGVYHSKNIPITHVTPKQYLMFDGLRLPFFNNISEYVKLEYGDVINSVSIYMDHSYGGRITIQKHWSEVYDEYEKYKEQAVQNTHNRIYKNKNYTGTNKKIIRCKDDINTDINPDINTDINTELNDGLNEDFIYNEFTILSYIDQNDVGTLYVEDEKFLYYCFVVKYYFPQVTINYYMYENINCKTIFNLNFVDKVYCANQELLNSINDPDIMYLTKPQMKVTNVITFGTYDLFHHGHYNLFKRSKKYGNNLVVGVSSDQLNNTKGKTTVNQLSKRMEDVKDNEFVDEIFVEESLEEKDTYIKAYKADLLIMGDDWKDKFDWVSCMTKYIPRTPDISTEMLKEKLVQNKNNPN